MIEPYTILDADGLKMGVIGMGNVSAISQLMQGGNSLGITPLDTDQTIEYYASLLRPRWTSWSRSRTSARRRRNHRDNEPGPAGGYVQQVRGDVDVVFGGHSTSC